MYITKISMTKKSVKFDESKNKIYKTEKANNIDLDMVLSDIPRRIIENYKIQPIKKGPRRLKLFTS